MNIISPTPVNKLRMPSILQSIPESVWRSEDFNCEEIFDKIFKSSKIYRN